MRHGWIEHDRHVSHTSLVLIPEVGFSRFEDDLLGFIIAICEIAIGIGFIEGGFDTPAEVAFFWGWGCSIFIYKGEFGRSGRLTIFALILLAIGFEECFDSDLIEFDFSPCFEGMNEFVHQGFGDEIRQVFLLNVLVFDDRKE